MLELGPEAASLHARAGEDAGFLDGLIVVGTLARELGRGARQAGLAAGALHQAESTEAAARHAVSWLRPGDVILVKGSRGMHLEQAVARLVEALGERG
jgi:UDP-N-acetylmuramoyl-tripeptide--D-alanyl-D-alanine ligase